MGDADDHAPRTRGPRWRIALAGAVTVAALAAAGAIAYRVLAPAEVVTEATRAYPAVPARPAAGVIGTFSAAPLIVDGRLRVYATKRQIRADAPVDARTQRSPYWSYRRWPEQVVGVVSSGTTVVGRWSDGQLTGIDAHTGKVAWRVDGPAPAPGGYAGRRTGASTVYTPDGLYTAGGVVIAQGRAGDVVAVRAAGGRELWRLAAPGAGCSRSGFTTAGGRLALSTRCPGGRTEVSLIDASTGRAASWPARPEDLADLTPLGCRVGRSECAGMRAEAGGTGTTADGSGAAGATGHGAGGATGSGSAAPDGAGGPGSAGAVGSGVGGPGAGGAGGPAVAAADGGGGAAGTARAWSLRGPEPVPAPGLAAPGTWLVAAPGLGDLGVTVDGAGRAVARRADTGATVWTWLPGSVGPEGTARVIAVQPGRVHLLTGGYWLATVDAATGVESSRFLFTYGRERTGWDLGHTYAADGYLLAERLEAGAGPERPDDEYYFIFQPILLAAG